MKHRKAMAQKALSDAEAATLEAQQVKQSDVRLSLWVEHTHARADLLEFACTYPEGVSYRPVYADAMDFESALRRSEGRPLWELC